MGIIESYRTPTTAYELGLAVEMFLRDGLSILPDELERGEWGIDALVDLEDGPGARVIVQHVERAGMRWEELDDVQQRLIRAWEDAGEPPIERIDFNPGPANAPRKRKGA